MTRGTSLIEVMVSLLMIMTVCTAVTKLTLLSIRSNHYSEALTFASALGHEKLVWLKGQSDVSPDLTAAWHQDQENPISCNNVRFYRFWHVTDVPVGKQVELHVAWDDLLNANMRNFSSFQEMNGSNCISITIRETFIP